jgi:hypothetical protein
MEMCREKKKRCIVNVAARNVIIRIRLLRSTVYMSEMIIDPWSNIISLKKEYHGIRVPGHKKSASVYRRFMPQLSDNWDTVAEKCKSARVFTDSIQLLHDRTD